VTDFLDQKRREIDSRLKELKPLVEEYARLEVAAAALQGVNGTAATPTTPRRRGAAKRSVKRRTSKKAQPARAKAASRTTKKGRRGAGRPKGSGRRSAEALKYVQGQPGITIPELAAKMGIAQNYLYRVLPGLQEEKKVRKDGRGWHAVA